MSLTAKVERSVSINAYGAYGQRDECVSVVRTIKTVGNQPQYVWVGNDRYDVIELLQAINAVRADRSITNNYAGIYQPGTK